MSEPTPFPEQIDGAALFHIRRVPSRPGELPELAVLIGRYPDRPAESDFVVWTAAVRDGEWGAFQGDYDLNLSAAWTEFYRRVSGR